MIENLRIWITGLLAETRPTLLLMIGGVRYLFAGGDPGQHERAKGSIRAALTGYALALLAPVLVSIVQQIVGNEAAASSSWRPPFLAAALVVVAIALHRGRGAGAAADEGRDRRVAAPSTRACSAKRA